MSNLPGQSTIDNDLDEPLDTGSVDVGVTHGLNVPPFLAWAEKTTLASDAGSVQESQAKREDESLEYILALIDETLSTHDALGHKVYK